jgi:hypothetical protein
VRLRGMELAWMQECDNRRHESRRHEIRSVKHDCGSRAETVEVGGMRVGVGSMRVGLAACRVGRG